MMSAVWIGPVESDIPPAGRRPAHWLRVEFEVSSERSDAPSSEFGERLATMTFSACGLVEIFVNGSRVGDELMPGYQQYSSRLPLRKLSIPVVQGMNAIAVLLGDGWFRGQTGLPRASDQWGSHTAFIGSVELDGTPLVATGEGWRTGPSHVISADLIAGQVEDRRLADKAVLLAGFDDTSWSPVRVDGAEPKGWTHGAVNLVPYVGEPVRRIEVLPALSVRTIRPNVHVADFGQNINGWCRLSNLGPAGTRSILTHGEWLDAEGDVTQSNLEVNIPIFPQALAPGAVDEVISAGVADDVFEPRLTTHGFQYVRIEGHPGPLGPADISAIVVHTDLRRIGTFTTDNQRLNRFHDAAVWSMRGNVCEIPTDCPQRERSGWTGDWQIFSPTAAFLYDVDVFSRRWLADVRADQRSDGATTNISPANRSEGFSGPVGHLNGSVGWGDVLVLTPWALYEAYGTTDALEENWEAMERWVGFGARSAAHNRSQARIDKHPEPLPHEQYLWDTGFHWGEWLEPDFDLSDFGAFIRADKSDVATAYLHWSALHVSKIAAVLGKPQATIDYYEDLAAGAKDAWQREYVDPDGSLTVSTQAAHVRALMFDLVPTESRGAVAASLAAAIRAGGTTVRTGFLATGMLLPALAENGYAELAEELLMQPNFPGWLYMTDHGATTVWERWEGVDADGVPHESLNHYSKGAVISYLHRYVAGLRPTSPGYRTFEVKPHFGSVCQQVELTLEIRHGIIRVEWQRVSSGFLLSVVVPEGSVASVHTGLTEPITVSAGEHRFDCSPSAAPGVVDRV